MTAPRAEQGRAMVIMVAGPYRSGAATDDEAEENLRALTVAALAVFDRGHIPVVGVHAALPLIAVAGQERYAELMMPISLALAERCDACLRIGGPSTGADEEVERFRASGRPVYASVEEIPVGRARG